MGGVSSYVARNIGLHMPSDPFEYDPDDDLIMKVRAGNWVACRQMLVNGYPVDEPDEMGTGNTALHHACRLGHLRIAKLLLSYDAPLHIGNKQGQTPFDMAVTYGQCNIVRWLCQQYYMDTIDTPDKGGATPLLNAAVNGDHKMFRLLLDMGSQIAIPRTMVSLKDRPIVEAVRKVAKKHAKRIRLKVYWRTWFTNIQLAKAMSLTESTVVDPSMTEQDKLCHPPFRLPRMWCKLVRLGRICQESMWEMKRVADEAERLRQEAAEREAARLDRKRAKREAHKLAVLQQTYVPRSIAKAQARRAERIEEAERQYIERKATQQVAFSMPEWQPPPAVATEVWVKKQDDADVTGDPLWRVSKDAHQRPIPLSTLQVADKMAAMFRHRKKVHRRVLATTSFHNEEVVRVQDVSDSD